VSERPPPVDEEPTALCQVADRVESVGLILHQLHGVVGCVTMSVSGFQWSLIFEHVEADLDRQASCRNPSSYANKIQV
jgi:hypothetical protein